MYVYVFGVPSPDHGFCHHNRRYSHAYQLVSPSSALKEGYVGVAWARDGDTSWYKTEHVYKTTTNS